MYHDWIDYNTQVKTLSISSAILIWMRVSCKYNIYKIILDCETEYEMQEMYNKSWMSKEVSKPNSIITISG